MFRFVGHVLIVLGVLSLIGISSLFGTKTTAGYNEGWCAGFAEYDLENDSRGLPLSRRMTRTINGFSVKLDDGRVMTCGGE
jgi:hypothetical protein